MGLARCAVSISFLTLSPVPTGVSQGTLLAIRCNDHCLFTDFLPGTASRSCLRFVQLLS